LHKLTTATLLSIQQNRIGVNLKAITDETIMTLLKCGLIRAKSKDNNKDSNPNLIIVIPSQKSMCMENLPVKKGIKQSYLQVKLSFSFAIWDKL